MSVVYLRGAGNRGATLLSNQFIDEYMPKANGEFVKIYIYLQRSLSEGEGELRTSLIADKFLCTEGDVLRALKYWEGEGLLSLTFEADGQLSAIRFGEDAQSPQVAAVVNPEPDQPAVITPISVGRQAMLTPDRVKELKKNEEVTSLLFIAEKYLGKSLSFSETEKLLYFYDQMHMSVDLIDHLIQMCVESGHPSIHYIESVARSWAKEGIDTVEKATAAAVRFKKDYFSILRAMGVSNRNPVEGEVEYMSAWLDKYGFSLDLIFEACSRTVLKTGQASFPYADSILKKWHEQGVRTLDDVKAADEKYSQQSRETARGAERRPATKSATSAPNRFNNFTQRDYNFEELERKILNQ